MFCGGGASFYITKRSKKVVISERAVYYTLMNTNTSGAFMLKLVLANLYFAVGHFDGEEAVAKGVFAESVESAEQQFEHHLANQGEGAELYIDRCCSFAEMYDHRLVGTPETAGSEALFFVVGHVEDESLVCCLVEAANVDDAVTITMVHLESESEGREVHFDLVCSLEDVVTPWLSVLNGSKTVGDCASHAFQANVTSLDMLSIEITEDAMEYMTEHYDVFIRDDNDEEVIFDASHLSDPDPDIVKERDELAELLGVIPAFVDGYLCLYVAR